MSTPIEKIATVLLMLVWVWSITLTFMHYRVVKERNTIIKAHCDAIDVSTGTFKCANGKVYLLGVKE